MKNLLAFIGAACIMGMLLAATIKYNQAIMVEFSPIFADPGIASGNVGTTPATGIADRSPASEGSFQRLVIRNTHATQNLCVFWLAAAGDCTAASRDCDLAGTDDGTLIPPGGAWAPTVAGDLRTCVVGSAATTTFQISRAEAP